MKIMPVLLLCSLILAGCAQDPYHLDITNNMSGAHGKSIYYRSNMRSSYAAQLRRTLSKKFGEMGLKPATAVDHADYIAIFDVETFYKQSSEKFNPAAYNNSQNTSVLFSDAEDDESLSFSGNANVSVNEDKTCFTLKMGQKGTSRALYSSSFCANGVRDTEEMLPAIIDVYSKYATYQSANVGVRCRQTEAKEIMCSAINDRQQEFINSLWSERTISDD
ncbi:MAG: hypothetical protein IKO06_04480 [Alphaproteobacteria bacterium]|nr:hypothetical protein [Alphaproteobacteria bacterium]